MGKDYIAIGLALYFYSCQCMMMNIEVIKGFGIDLPFLVFHSTTLILNSLSESVFLHYTATD